MTLYLDTSSLVKLYVAEADSDAVHDARRFGDRCRDILHCVPRDPSCTGEAASRAPASSSRICISKKTFEADWPSYLVIEVTSALCRQAGEFADATCCEPMTVSIWPHSPKLPVGLGCATRVSRASTTR